MTCEYCKRQGHGEECAGCGAPLVTKARTNAEMKLQLALMEAQNQMTLRAQLLMMESQNQMTWVGERP